MRKISPPRVVIYNDNSTQSTKITILRRLKIEEGGDHRRVQSYAPKYDFDNHARMDPLPY